MKIISIPFVLAVAFAAGCGDSTAPLPPAVDHDAQGSWSQDSHGSIFPGSSFLLMLTESDGSIIGSGSFSGEAAPYGSLQVSGTVRQDSVRLQIIAVAEPTVFPNLPPDTTQFVGLLANKNAITGQRLIHGVTVPFDLARLQPVVDPH